MASSHGDFAGWYLCPHCDEETRHYDTGYYRTKSIKKIVYCELCGLTRFISKRSDGVWKFGSK